MYPEPKPLRQGSLLPDATALGVRLLALGVRLLVLDLRPLPRLLPRQ